MFNGTCIAPRDNTADLVIAKSPGVMPNTVMDARILPHCYRPASRLCWMLTHAETRPSTENTSSSSLTKLNYIKLHNWKYFFNLTVSHITSFHDVTQFSIWFVLHHFTTEAIKIKHITHYCYHFLYRWSVVEWKCVKTESLLCFTVENPEHFKA